MRTSRLGNTKVSDLPYYLINLLFCVFFITKMYRAFTGSGVAGGIWNYIQLLFIAVGLFIFLTNVQFVTNNSMALCLLFYFLFASLHSVFGIHFSKDSLFLYSTIPYSFCVFVIAYFEGYRHPNNKRKLIVFTFYVIAAIYIISMIRKTSYSTKTGAVADVYYALSLLPLVMAYQKRFKLLPIMVCAFAVLVSGKRAGLLAVVIMVIAYYLYNAIIERKVSTFLRNVFILGIVAAVFLFALFKINSDFNTNYLNRLNSMINDGGSGRIDRWKLLIHEILYNSGVIKLIFGHGIGATFSLCKNAHNDYLEVFYNYGFVPLMAYIGFYVAMFRSFVLMVKKRYKYSIQFFMSFICAIFLSMLSFYVIDKTYITAGMLCAGTIYADFCRQHPEALKKQSD